MFDAFRKMSLEMRIRSAFLVVGSIILIVAFIGWWGNLQLSRDLRTISDKSFPSEIALWQIKEGQTQIQSSDRALLNGRAKPEDRQKAKTRIEGALQQIETGFQQYKAIAVQRDSTEEELYQDFQSKWDAWKKTRDEFIQLNQQFESYNIPNPLLAEVNLLRQGQTNSPQITTAKAASQALERMNDLMFQTKGPALEAARYALIELLDYNNQLATQAKTAAERSIAQTSFAMLAGTVIGLILAISLGWYFGSSIARPLGAKIDGAIDVAQKISGGDLTADIAVNEQQDNDELGKLLIAFRRMSQGLNTLVRQVQKSGIQITTSTTEIAASGKQLEAAVNEQVASSNQVVATAKQIATTSGKLVKTMDEVAALSWSTAEAANQGQEDLERMEATMRQLSAATGSISGRLGTISEKANNINSVVTTIAKVADQTNLLSLNAAIEAEKAGEYGVGFAVVAREIRRLADQTAVATLDIESMVKEMQSAVATGVMEMDKFTQEVNRRVEDIRSIGTQLSQIVKQVQALTPRFDTVKNGMEAQSESGQQISEAMFQLSSAFSQTAESLREINKAIEQLNEAAQGMRQEVSRFKVS
jgi:methyl-accepting chemotaxis protein WspA